jgi:hypothetical protein
MMSPAKMKLVFFNFFLLSSFFFFAGQRVPASPIPCSPWHCFTPSDLE